MHHSRFIFIALLLVAILTVAGCSPLSTPQVPTADLQAIEQTVEAVKTQAAISVIMELTANAPQATPTTEPTQEPTATLEPTAEPTPLPALPTAASQPIVLPTATFIPLPTATATPSPYACTIVSQSPASGATFKVNEDFDLVVKIKNSGTQNWDQHIADFFYVSGTKFQTFVDVIDMPEAVQTGKEVTLIIDMRTPDKAGTYTAVWGVGEGALRYCSVNINVKVSQ